jgi:hypothetical protein
MAKPEWPDETLVQVGNGHVVAGLSYIGAGEDHRTENGEVRDVPAITRLIRMFERSDAFTRGGMHLTSGEARRIARIIA